jgi:hypothetical protein
MTIDGGGEEECYYLHHGVDSSMELIPLVEPQSFEESGFGLALGQSGSRGRHICVCVCVWERCWRSGGGTRGATAQQRVDVFLGKQRDTKDRENGLEG